MPAFTRFYKDNELKEISMIEMEELIQNKKNKKIIANYVYERLYTRFLKIFEFETTEEKEYDKFKEKVKRNVFQEEYKNGFLQMASCSLLIETFSGFLTGENDTPKDQGVKRFIKVFEYAKKHKNKLEIFEKEPLYYNIRCGLLHQGETKGKYLITREGKKLFNKDEKKIDAYLFHKNLTKLLKTYKTELEENNNWNLEIWDTCRMKIRHIINNSK